MKWPFVNSMYSYIVFFTQKIFRKKKKLSPIRTGQKPTQNRTKSKIFNKNPSKTRPIARPKKPQAVVKSEEA